MPKPSRACSPSLPYRLRSDLHVHLGIAPDGYWAKIPAGRDLRLPALLPFAKRVKGLDVVGVVDMHIPAARQWLRQSLQDGDCQEQPGGGYLFSEQLLLILGCELEVRGEKGPVHLLTYFPSLSSLDGFADYLNHHTTTLRLSSQLCRAPAASIAAMVASWGGVLAIAHAFTPHKSLYGNHDSMRTVLGEAIPVALELGLSADTTMVQTVADLQDIPLLASSDAHSLERIGREFTLVETASYDFAGLFAGIAGHRGSILANYGLYPSLGKYYLTTCLSCGSAVGANCDCGRRLVKGVAERITELAKVNEIYSQQRPPYIHQVPLIDWPGIGRVTLQRVREELGTDFHILHEATYHQLRSALPARLACAIIRGREGCVNIKPGGGGRYGRVKQS